MHELKITETTWLTIRDALKQFYAAHPELGFHYTEDSQRYFARRFGKDLVERGVARRVHAKAPLLVDIREFDSTAFDLLTGHWSVEKESRA